MPFNRSPQMKQGHHLPPQLMNGHMQANGRGQRRPNPSALPPSPRSSLLDSFRVTNKDPHWDLKVGFSGWLQILY